MEKRNCRAKEVEFLLHPKKNLEYWEDNFEKEKEIEEEKERFYKSEIQREVEETAELIWWRNIAVTRHPNTKITTLMNLKHIEYGNGK